MKKLTKVSNSMSESLTHDMASVYFVEVASNVYLIKKHRKDSCQGKYVDGAYVAKELNTGFNVVLLKVDGELLSNFSKQPYREFLVDTLNREVI